jgi:UDPglucose 6-dehydrogenase
MRDSTGLGLWEELRVAGAEVTAHDPVAMDVAKEWYLDDRIVYAEDEYAACDDADALLIVTEWQQYRRPTWERIGESLRSKVIFDGRNLFRPSRMQELGYEYHSIGRQPVK